jgi:acetyl esterase/lipase
LNQGAQMDTEIIPVWPDRVPDAELWRDAGPELDRPRRTSGTTIRNVSRPTLTVFLPDPSLAVGTGVIVCPGGAFHWLSFDKEGTDVARWLNARGVAAFVLKYRVLPTPDDDEAFLQIAANPTPHRPKMDRVRPMVIADGVQAVRTIRQQAQRWNIAPDRLGILGFSAGGYVAVGAATKSDAESRPNFAASLYGEWWERWVPAAAPPLFLAAASNDPLIDVRANSSLYEAWYGAGRRAELHIYAQGGHGFGVTPQGLPSDTWIDRFWEWLQAEGFVPQRDPARP